MMDCNKKYMKYLLFVAVIDLDLDTVIRKRLGQIFK